MNINELVSKNQTIKIVPPVEDSLRAIGLDVQIDEETKIWLDQLKFKWKTWKKSTATDQHFNLFFQLTSDPFRVALVCIIKCEEFKDCKPKSLPYYIIETLNQWSQINAQLPEDSLKLPAFHIAINQRNQHFLNLIIKTYNVSTIKDSIIPIVKNMIRNDNCKQALQIVIVMELFQDIPVEELLFPLILQDKANMIDEYLYECPNQVQSLLIFLDKLLDKKFHTRSYVQHFIEEYNVCNVKYEKIHHKPLGKLVARLCSKFKIPIETCKNLSKNRTVGGLRYLIHQKYLENNLSVSVWDDLVRDSLQKSPECVEDFIDLLIDYDTNEALKWATHFQLPENSIPLALKELTLTDVEKEESWDVITNSENNFYRLPISEDKIFLIDSGEKFYDLVTDLENHCIVSIDCEWKPSFGATQSQVALIQIATFDNVYLIDTLKLNDKQYASFWYRFNKSLLENAEIIKLGFGLEQDLKEMKASVVGLNNIRVSGEGLLDLGLLWKALTNYGLSLPSDSDNEGNSLSSLVQSCFGLPLEKSEQCSNWELRPLRNTQVYYAALDAYVLLEIYKYLQKSCNEQCINFEDISNDVMLEKKLKNVKKTKVADQLLASTTQESKHAKDIKMLLEPDVSYLDSYLRYCGIDTIIISRSMLWHDAVNIALAEDRCILTSKLKFTPTKTFPQSSILDVGKVSIKLQLQKVFSHFSITIEQSNFLSRCLKCNEIDLKILNPTDVQNICSKLLSPVSNNSSINEYKCNSDYEDDGYDNFLSDSEGEDECLYQTEKKIKNPVCVTSKGVQIQICNIKKLSTSNKSATLCENCGQLYWDEDELKHRVHKVILQSLNIKG